MLVALLSRCRGLSIERTRCLGVGDDRKSFTFLQNEVTWVCIHWSGSRHRRLENTPATQMLTNS